MKPPKKFDYTQEARDWGRGCGRVASFNGWKLTRAKGSGLRGMMRDAFINGEERGYNEAKAEREANPC